MSFLEKLQKLPAGTRKMILWTTATILGICLLLVCLGNFQERLKNFKAEDIKGSINFPSLEGNANILEENQKTEE